MFNLYRGALDLESPHVQSFIDEFKNKFNLNQKNNMLRDVKKVLYFYNHYDKIENPITIFVSKHFSPNKTIVAGPSPGNTRLIAALLLNKPTIDTIFITSPAIIDKQYLWKLSKGFEPYHNIKMKPLDDSDKVEVSVPEHFNQRMKDSFYKKVEHYYQNQLSSFDNTKWIDSNSNTLFQTGNGSSVIRVTDRMAFFEHLVKEY